VDFAQSETLSGGRGDVFEDYGDELLVRRYLYSASVTSDETYSLYRSHGTYYFIAAGQSLTICTDIKACNLLISKLNIHRMSSRLG